MSERIPRSQRAPDNPMGYVREPDDHPRVDALPQEDLGILGRLREAYPLLSVGNQQSVRAEIPQGAKLGGFRHTSPEPRVLRANFPNITDAERVANVGVGVALELVEGVDTSGGKQTVYVPLQGIAFPVPAGILTADILRGNGQQAAADNTLNITISAGVLASRWYTDPWNGPVATVVAVFPATTVLAAPRYATRVRVLVMDGALVSFFTGAPFLTAGQIQDGPIGPEGTISLSGIAGTVVVIQWEITQ